MKKEAKRECNNLRVDYESASWPEEQDEFLAAE